MESRYDMLFIGEAGDASWLGAALGSAKAAVALEVMETRQIECEGVETRVAAAPPDVIVLGPTLSSPLSMARHLRDLSPRSQIVFVLPPERVERFRASLPFVSNLGAAWTVSNDATPDTLRAVLQEAASTSRQRANRVALYDRINLQLASRASTTESQARRSQLALSERYLATLLNQSPDAFLAVDRQGRLVAWNEAARQLFPIHSDDALGTDAVALFPEGCRDEINQLIDMALQGRMVRREVPLRMDAGEAIIHGDISVASVHDNNGEIISVSISARDITERRRVEEELRQLNETLEQRVAQAIAERVQAEDALRQAQKMEAIGQLSGGIAHDFNNMLSVVLGSLDLLSRRIGPAPQARRYVEAAMEGARRAAELTQRLLAFARQQSLKPEPLDANSLLAGMSEMLRRSLGADVRLETVFSGGLWRTCVDRNQLESAILNLAINARDAMPDGGRLTIETQNGFLDDRYAAAHPEVVPGQYVLIAVTDTGEGMPPEVMAKVFDPFFTTKEVGRGTGLGLSQVYGFVKQTGGHVKIYSEVGQGTTVKIYLPRYFSRGDEPIDAPAPAVVPLAEQHEVILVVEDEPAVRQFSVEALVELGYDVLEAHSATAALRLLDAHPEIVLLFTDVVMPDVNGRKLADEAKRRRPELKILFTTGYTRNAIVHNGVLDPGVELIGKPFTIDDLAAKIRKVLDAP